MNTNTSMSAGSLTSLEGSLLAEIAGLSTRRVHSPPSSTSAVAVVAFHALPLPPPTFRSPPLWWVDGLELTATVIDTPGSDVGAVAEKVATGLPSTTNPSLEARLALWILLSIFQVSSPTVQVAMSSLLSEHQVIITSAAVPAVPSTTASTIEASTADEQEVAHFPSRLGVYDDLYGREYGSTTYGGDYLCSFGALYHAIHSSIATVPSSQVLEHTSGIALSGADSGGSSWVVMVWDGSVREEESTMQAIVFNDGLVIACCANFITSLSRSLRHDDMQVAAPTLLSVYSLPSSLRGYDSSDVIITHDSGPLGRRKSGRLLGIQYGCAQYGGDYGSTSFHCAMLSSVAHVTLSDSVCHTSLSSDVMVGGDSWVGDVLSKVYAMADVRVCSVGCVGGMTLGLSIGYYQLGSVFSECSSGLNMLSVPSHWLTLVEEELMSVISVRTWLFSLPSHQATYVLSTLLPVGWDTCSASRPQRHLGIFLRVAPIDVTVADSSSCVDTSWLQTRRDIVEWIVSACVTTSSSSTSRGSDLLFSPEPSLFSWSTAVVEDCHLLSSCNYSSDAGSSFFQEDATTLAVLSNNNMAQSVVICDIPISAASSRLQACLFAVEDYLLSAKGVVLPCPACRFNMLLVPSCENKSDDRSRSAARFSAEGALDYYISPLVDVFGNILVVHISDYVDTSWVPTRSDATEWTLGSIGVPLSSFCGHSSNLRVLSWPSSFGMCSALADQQGRVGLSVDAERSISAWNLLPSSHYGNRVHTPSTWYHLVDMGYLWMAYRMLIDPHQFMGGHSPRYLVRMMSVFSTCPLGPAPFISRDLLVDAFDGGTEWSVFRMFNSAYYGHDIVSDASADMMTEGTGRVDSILPSCVASSFLQVVQANLNARVAEDVMPLVLISSMSSISSFECSVVSRCMGDDFVVASLTHAFCSFKYQLSTWMVVQARVDAVGNSVSASVLPSDYTSVDASGVSSQSDAAEWIGSPWVTSPRLSRHLLHVRILPRLFSFTRCSAIDNQCGHVGFSLSSVASILPSVARIMPSIARVMVEMFVLVCAPPSCHSAEGGIVAIFGSPPLDSTALVLVTDGMNSTVLDLVFGIDFCSRTDHLSTGVMQLDVVVPCPWLVVLLTSSLLCTTLVQGLSIHSINGRSSVPLMSTTRAPSFPITSLDFTRPDVVVSTSVTRGISTLHGSALSMSSDLATMVLPYDLFLWMLNGVAGLVHNGGCDFITCDWRCKSGRYICSLRYSSQYGGALPSMSSTIGSSFVVGLTVDTCYRLVDNSISPVMTVWKNIYFTCNDSSAHHSDHKVGCVVYDISSNTHLLVVGDISACAPSSRSRTTFDAVKCNFVGATTLSPRHDELDLQASPWSLLSTMKTAVEDPASAHNASIAVMSVICVCGVGDCRAAHPLSYYFDLSAASSACWSLISCRHTYMDSLLDSTSSRRLPADVVSMCCTLEPELVLISPSDYRSQPSSVFLGFTGWSVMCYSGFASSSWYYSESSPGLLVTWCYMPSTLLHFLHFQRCCMKSRHLHILLSTMVSVGYFTQVSRCRILVASRNNIYASSVLVLLCRWLRLRRIAVVSSWWSLFPVSSAVLLIYDLTCRLSFSSTFGADSSFPRHFVAGPSRAYYSSTDWIMVSPSAPSAFSSLDWISLCGISPSSPVKLVGYGITLLCVVAVCLQNVYAHCALVFDAWMNFELAIETFRYSRWNGSVAVDASASSPWNQAWPNFSAACTWYYVTQIVWLISTSHLSMGDLLGTRFNHYHAPRCQVSVSCFGTVFTSWYGALILFIVSCQWSVLRLPTVVSYGWPMLLAFSAFVDSTYCPGMAYTHSTYWTVMAILVSHRASWFVRHGFQYLLIECCGHFDFAETMLVLILRGFVVCSSLFLVTTHCTMILSGLLEGTIDPMETGPAASRISPAEYIWVDDLMLDLLGSLSALQIVISSTGVLGLTTIGTHLLDGSSFAEVLMSKDYLRALQLNVAKSYGRWYSRVGNAEGGVLVMISSLFQEHRQSLRLVLATTVYFLGCFHHVNGTVGFISIVEYLPLLFSQYGCFELRIDSILADLHSWCLLWTDLIVAVAYWKYLVRTERNVSIVDLVQLIWPSNMSIVPLGDSSLVYWSLPKRRTFVSTRDLIDRSLTRCSGLIDDGISIENLFDPSLPRCNEWINMFGWICGLSPLPICNAWMTKFLDLLLPKYSIMIQRIVSLLSSWTSWLSTVPSMAWLYHLMHEAVAVKWYSGLLADATFFQFFAFLRSVLPIIPLVPIHVLFGP